LGGGAASGSAAAVADGEVGRFFAGCPPEVADRVGAELGAASTGLVGAGASAASSIQPLAPLLTSWMRIKPSFLLIARNGRPAGKPNIAEADADVSGSLTADEFTTFHEILRARMAAHRFERADTNGDGAVTLEELAESRGRRHRRGPEL